MRKHRGHSHGPHPGSPVSRPQARHRGEAAVVLYGIHAVEAALRNPLRRVHGLSVTANAAERLAGAIAERGVTPTLAEPRDFDRLTSREAVHQGAVLETSALPAPDLERIITEGLERGRAQPLLIVVLDQVTDPHNVGAILRSAAAFGADALVMTERNSPPLSGTLAKSASGGLEHVPVAAVPNLARVLQSMGETALMRVGLDGEAPDLMESIDLAGPVALVLGAEEKGMRRLTREHCDRTARLATTGAIRSLNVSNAAAIAMHTVRWGQRGQG